jgi:hypothetical protein
MGGKVLHHLVLRMPLLTAFVLMANAAAAEAVKVASGKPTVLGFFNIYQKSTCSGGGKPDVNLKQPANGTLRVEWGSGKNNADDGCKGRTTKGYRLIYTSKKGFRGPDSGMLYFSYPTYPNSPTKATRKIPITIEVR